MNISSFDYDDDYLKKLEEVEGESFVRIVGIVVLFMYVIVLICGVPGNIYVLCRLSKLARDDPDKYTNGTGSGLFAMAATDLIALISISLHNILSAISLDISDWILNLLCKVLLFITHTVTSVSIWCWLLMSTLRYLAIRHPLFHLRLWRAPNRAITFIVIMSSATNIWLLLAVSYNDESCAQQSLDNDGSLNRWMHLMECVWSFCLPVTVIIYMDAMVIIFPRFQYRAANESKLVSNKRIRCKANTALWKWLTIAFIDVLLNTPENLYRLFILCGIMSTAIPDVYNFSARMVAQVLYFTQFAFNATYLALFVYDNSIRPRTATPALNQSHKLVEKPTASLPSPPPRLAGRRFHSQRETSNGIIVKCRSRSSTESNVSARCRIRRNLESDA